MGVHLPPFCSPPYLITHLVVVKSVARLPWVLMWHFSVLGGAIQYGLHNVDWVNYLIASSRPCTCDIGYLSLSKWPLCVVCGTCSWSFVNCACIHKPCSIVCLDLWTHVIKINCFWPTFVLYIKVLLLFIMLSWKFSELLLNKLQDTDSKWAPRSKKVLMSFWAMWRKVCLNVRW